MQEVRRGMVRPRCAPTLGIDAQFDDIAECELATRYLDDMNMQIPKLLFGVDDFTLRCLRGKDGADIADLAAAFAVERRLIGKDANGFAGAGALDADAVLDDRVDRTLGGFGVVA